MPRARTTLLLTSSLLAACAGNPDRQTLAGLRDVEPDVTEVRVEDTLDQAMIGYRKFLEETPESALTPEAMRRLADLKLEKEFGLLGDGELVELPTPEATSLPARAAEAAPTRRPAAAGIPEQEESEADFERRAGSATAIAASEETPDLDLPGREQAEQGPLEAIALYERILATYPTYEHKDQVLYQMARAYDELARTEEAIAVMERLAEEYPSSRHLDEVHFRRAEYFFTRKKYLDAEEGYGAVVAMGPGSDYYELALYKLGWTFYKQEMHEEALHQYIALLDYNVSTGYDFDQSEDEAAERRIADTYRVISLSFSSLGGTEVVQEYFRAHGQRTYEDRIYSHLGEFYLDKLRYHDAAAAYQAFIDLHPLHRAAPHFSMRTVEIYEAGSFPILVLESKKKFAATYGLQSDYWRHFDVDAAPEVIRYLKANLTDLANHYHALYQEVELADEQPENFREALRWYRAYLESFPEDEEAPSVNYRLADLLLEHGDFGEAAREYERTAYEHPEHERAAAAGYAAIYAHREHEKQAIGEEQAQARSQAVASTLRFVEAFPAHEHAAAVLGAAVDDLYSMNEFERTIATGHALIDAYPEADPAIRRSAWAAIAHASFDTDAYEKAESAYARVLEMTPEDDDARQAVVDNLAAAIYKQGEQARVAEDSRAAADHFLRVAEVAPTSEIRPLAEYDAGAALIRLEDWAAAAEVLDAFRETYPEHELHEEATKQIAFVYREEGDLSRAAGEYERVAAETADPQLQSEALLLAGELYEDAEAMDRALAAYRAYVGQFPEPIEAAVETRFKIAELLEATGDAADQHEELRRIVEIDATAGGERTPRVRYLAARSALVLSEVFYHRFDEVELVQPFKRSLQEKQRRMNAALDELGALVDYEVGEVTAAATFYMAEVYRRFGQALLESERPSDLTPAELQDYELVLEEEAFPFEERAIEFHEKNLELMASGVFNAWIEKSLVRLGDVMPGRYAKFEASSGFITSIESYAYRAPNAALPGADATPVAEVAEPAPVPSSEGGAEASLDVIDEEPADVEIAEPAAPAAPAESAAPATPAESAAPAAPAEPAAPAAPAEPDSDGPPAASEDAAVAVGGSE